MSCNFSNLSMKNRYTLQEINISHLGKRKIIFIMDFSGDMLVPRRAILQMFGLLSVPRSQDTLKVVMFEACIGFLVAFAITWYVNQRCPVAVGERVVFFLFFSGSENWCAQLPSLKLTVRLWKWMVGILLSYWGGLFSGDTLVSTKVPVFEIHCSFFLNPPLMSNLRRIHTSETSHASLNRSSDVVGRFSALSSSIGFFPLSWMMLKYF